MTSPQPASRRPALGWTRVVAGVGAAAFLVFGLWAFADPESFFDEVATFEPYNQHLVQDIGAFQIGLGAVLLLAAVVPRPDAVAVALIGAGIGSAVHVLSHVIGHDLGGTPEVYIPVFTVLTGVLLVPGLLRWSGTRP